MPQAEKNEIIKEALRELQKNNKKLIVKWDAGGDETLVNFPGEKIMNYDDSLDKALTIYTELRSIIRKKLDLPNAGEDYDRGQGEIFLNERNQVILKFDSQRYYEVYVEAERKLEDKYNLIQYLAENTIVFNITKTDFNIDFYLFYELRDYKEIAIPITISAAAKAYYEDWGRQVFSLYEQKYKERNQPPIFIELTGYLREGSKVEFTITKAYPTTKPYSDQLGEVILIE